MTAPLPAFFFAKEDEHYVPTPMTRGPWDDGFQHGGPPAALLARAAERHAAANDYAVARMTVELLKPIPIAPLRVRLDEVRTGRAVERLELALAAGDRTVATARVVRIRRAPIDVPLEPGEPPWPDPETLADFEFSFFRNEVGYHRSVQMRVASGSWGTTPVAFWARSRIPLVAGEALSPLQNLVILADAQSGMGVPLDPFRFTFLNPDLTVYLERTPVPGWLGFEIRSTANREGAGLSQSAVRDARGLVARTVQSLVVARREPAR